MALAHFELHAWCLLVLGWVMVPFYMRSGVYTMPEFLERRFSPAARWVLSLISLVAYVLTKMAVGIFAGGVVFGVAAAGRAGSDRAWLRHGGQLLDRLGGGRRADRSLHGARRHAGRGLHRGGADGGARDRLAAADDVRTSRRVGGWSGAARVARSGDVQPVEADRAGRRRGHVGAGERGRPAWRWYFNQNYPWPGMLFCAPIIGLWYWCTDQYIVQRTLGAKGEREARQGTIFAAYLKLLPLFIFIVPGMIAVALARSGRMPRTGAARRTPMATPVAAQTQAAFPLMVQAVMPPGFAASWWPVCWPRS